MTLARKIALLAAVSALISTALTLYTYEAHTIAAQYIYEDPGGTFIAWRTGASGSLFPWPREPGMADILSKVNDVDTFIYRYLIKRWILVTFSTLAWLITCFLTFRAFRQPAKQERQEDQQPTENRLGNSGNETPRTQD